LIELQLQLLRCILKFITLGAQYKVYCSALHVYKKLEVC
jgi:hypothetical protein